MVRTFDDAAGVVTVQSFEVTFGEVYLELRVRLGCLFDAGYELVVGIAYQDTGETRRERKNIIAAVAAKDDIGLIIAKIGCALFERGLLGRAVRQEVEQALTGL